MGPASTATTTTTSGHDESLKLDSNGLVLIPQPSPSPLDPLNYPNWLRYMILIEFSLLGFVSAFGGALLSPAADQLARDFNIQPHAATHASIVYLIIGALAPLFLVPFANVYGHRLVILCCTAVNVASNLAAAEANSFSILLVLRGLSGFGVTLNVLSVAVIPNLFFAHQRGRATGFYLAFSAAGSHFALMVGGYVSFRIGWRWALRIAGISLGTVLILVILLLPDTLFQRSNKDLTLRDRLDFEKDSRPREPHRPLPMKLSIFIRCLHLVNRERMPNHGVQFPRIIIRPFRLFKYPSVTIPIIYSSVALSFACLGPVIVAPAQFTELFRFNSFQNGLATGLSLMLGTIIGEVFSGPVTDLIIKHARKRAIKGGKPAKAEIRLHGLWSAAFLVPSGLLIYGFTIHYTDNIIAPCVALAVTAVGAQISWSVCVTYTCGDCYPAQSGDLSQCFNIVRNAFALGLIFYETPMALQIGYHWAFTIYAAICVLFFLFVIVLMLKGAEWRERLRMPTDS